MAKAVAPTADDELEVLEEESEAEVEEKPKRGRPKKGTAKPKAEKPKRMGKTTAEVAEALGTTPVKLRRILRSPDFFPDDDYTRYDLTEETIQRLKDHFASQAAAPTRRGRKAKAQKVEESAEEVLDELDSLEDEESEEDEELDLDEEEEDEG